MEALSLSCGKAKEKDDQEEGIEDAMILISDHSLYHDLLVQNHPNCMKFGGTDDLEEENDCKDRKQGQVTSKPNLSASRKQSELDQFMEPYCLALVKLKEAMEGTQQKSMDFISKMQLQLKELTASHPVEPAPTTLLVKPRNKRIRRTKGHPEEFEG